jgi:hypothetical protein
MTDPFMINVGGRSFTTLKSTLEQSPFLNAMLSNQWAGSTCYVNGMPFVDRSPLLFEHILDFLRSSVPPIFWTRMNGFDLPLYARLVHEAEYFQLEALTTWIRNEQYINTISITSSMEVIILSDCGRGKSHSGDIEQEFEPGTVSTVSKSGKSTTSYKRLLLRKSRLRLPVSDYVLTLMCILADTCCCRKCYNLMNAHKALHGVYRTTGTSSFSEVWPVQWHSLVGKQGQQSSLSQLLLSRPLNASKIYAHAHRVLNGVFSQSHQCTARSREDIFDPTR